MANVALIWRLDSSVQDVNEMFQSSFKAKTSSHQPMSLKVTTFLIFTNGDSQSPFAPLFHSPHLAFTQQWEGVGIRVKGIKQFRTT